MSPLVLIHVCSAVVGLLSGFLAMFLRKGSGLHRAAGQLFAVSMLSMSSSAAYIATFIRPVPVNAMMGGLTFYLVATGWWAGRRKNTSVGLFDYGALLFVIVDVAAGLMFAYTAATHRMKSDTPAGGYLVFASIGLLFAVADVRMLVQGSIDAARKLGRHLWRMCFALLIATLSFFPGQAKLFHRPFPGYLYIPHVFLIVSMIYWLVKVSRRKRRPAPAPISAATNPYLQTHSLYKEEGAY